MLDWLFVFIWISSCVSFEEKWKLLKLYLKDLWRYSKKLQKVRNHGNCVKNDVYFENREFSLGNLYNENNVSTAEEILTDYDECIQTVDNNK